MPAVPGHGQAVKICNNMILGVSMIAVSEAFVLAEKLGIDPQKLFDIASKASGQCWAMTNYCPVPGPVPTSPANRDYQAGFTAAMMLKDLKLAQDAAKSSGAKAPIGAAATALYSLFVEQGSAAYRLLRYHTVPARGRGGQERNNFERRAGQSLKQLTDVALYRESSGYSIRCNWKFN